MYKTFPRRLGEFLATVLTKGVPPRHPPAARHHGLRVHGHAAADELRGPKTAGTIAAIDKSGLVADALKESLNADVFAAPRTKKLEAAGKAAEVARPESPRRQSHQGDRRAPLDAAAPMLSVEILPATTDQEEAKKP